MKLTIHIIVFSKDNLAERQNIFVAMEGINRIKHFQRILNSGSHEKAMLFALTRGRIIDSASVKDSRYHLILTKDGAYWDLM